MWEKGEWLRVGEGLGVVKRGRVKGWKSGVRLGVGKRGMVRGGEEGGRVRGL